MSTLLARAIGDFGAHVTLEYYLASSGCSALLAEGLEPRLLTRLPRAQIWLSCCWLKKCYTWWVLLCSAPPRASYSIT